MSEVSEVTEVTEVTEDEPGSSLAIRQLAEIGLYDPDMDFRKLALEVHYRARGYRLVSKEQLVDIPHIVVGVTYREGFPREGVKGDYASIEAVVADLETLQMPQFRHLLDDMEVFPNEPVVYNDGSTGIRRTFTELFHEIGLIDVGDAKEGFNPYDRQYQLWHDGADLATTGIIADTNGEKFRYGAYRGLRRSDYTNEYGPGTTYYIG